MVIGQANLLRQLIRILLDNAHRSCPEAAEVLVRLWRRGRLGRLEVSDDGPGIDADSLPRLFDRFWRASNDRGDGGTGMGLAIAASISRAHGSDIRVASAPGQGSRFVVELPLAFR
jgi:signal transduction histidine kinase